MQETRIQLTTCVLLLPAGFNPAQFTFDLYMLGKRVSQTTTPKDGRKVRPKKVAKLA